MAALNGVFELSSILKTEDLEKCELTRKKTVTQQAIHQQEGRLSRETEEQHRIVGDVSMIPGKLDDIVSSMEMMELTTSELLRQAAQPRLTMVTNVTETWLKHATITFVRAELARELTVSAEGLQSAKNLDALQNTSTFQAAKQEIESTWELGTINTETLAACLKERKQKEGVLADIDVKAADACEKEDRLQDTKTTIGKDVARITDAIASLKFTMETHEKAFDQSKFQAGAYLGCKTEDIITLKQSIATEQRLLDKWITQQTACDRLSAELEQGETKLADDIDVNDTATAATVDRITANTSKRVDLRKFLASLQAELDSSNQLHQTTVLQSFQKRADALAEDVLQARSSASAKKAQLAVVEDMIVGSAVCVEIDTRRELLESVKEQERALSISRTELVARTASIALEEMSERTIIQELSLQHAALHDATSTAERTGALRALHARVLELQSTLAANASVEQIAAQRAQHAEKVQDSGTSREQLSKAALERAELQSGRLAERAALQLQVEEKKAANVIKHAATQKQVRLAAALSARQTASRQSLSRLRKLLLDDDKVFQEAQQRLSAEFNEALGALEHELALVKRKVINAATDVPRPSISAQQQHVTAGPTTPATTSAPIRTAIPAAGVDQDPQNSACLEGGNAPGGGSEDAEVIGAATRMVSEEGTAGVAASVARKSAGRQQKASKTAAGTSKGNKKRKSA